MVGQPGLHEEIVRILQPLTNKNTTILDLATGEGALALRLKDKGYSVEATSLENNSNKQLTGINLYQVNLNTDFSSFITEKYDVITAVEIIEHLESTKNFLRNCYKLLKSQGRLLITTPNIENLPSRLKFFLKGNVSSFEYFTHKDLYHHEPEHINPIFSLLLEGIANEIGFKIVKRYGYPNQDFNLCKKATKIISHILSSMTFIKGNKF